MDDTPGPATWPVTCRFCGATDLLDDWGNWVPCFVPIDDPDADHVEEPTCPACSDRYLFLCRDSHGRTVAGPAGVFPDRHLEYVLRCSRPVSALPVDAALERVGDAIDVLAGAIHAARADT